MNKTNIAVALALAGALAACGGGSGSQPGNQNLKTTFSAQVTFGDSLADVGTYGVGAIAAAGGGKFTINGDNTARDPALTGKNWTELTAAQFGLPPPCAAQTGLMGDAARGLSVPVADHAGCFGYAQGGARVSNPAGVGNAQTGSTLGALTVPVARQLANHLAASGGSFRGNEIVFVMAGMNEALSLLDEVAKGAVAGPDALAAMANAGAELAGLVRTQLVARGAAYVVVNGVPDLAASPAALAQPQATRELVARMVGAFNQQLQAGLAGEGKVLYVDLYTLTHDQAQNPAPYGLANTTTPACGPNPLGGNALACTSANTVAGADVGHFMFADGVHPTPFEGSLIARYILLQMTKKGWL